MYYFKEQGDAIGDGDFEYTIYDRANESLDDLRSSLGGKSQGYGPNRTVESKHQLSRSVNPRILTWEDGTPHHKPRSHASSKLFDMLSTSVKQMSPVAGPSIPIPPSHGGPLPSPEEAVTMLKNQAVYTSHLEGEYRYIKEEMSVLRMKLSEVMEENRSLHNELKSTVVHEILKEGGELVHLMDQGPSDNFSNVMNRHDFKRWQVELERLGKLHAAKSDRLESQLESSKSEVLRLEQIIDDLKSQLRIHDSLPTHENGLVGSAFFTETEKNITHRTIENLTRERDELMDHVTSLKSQLKEMSHREEEAYEQMKKGIQLVEQAQLEQTEALIQKEQVSDELLRVRERFETHVRESQNLVKVERDQARMEGQSLIDDLTNKLKELGELYATLQTRYDKEVREKGSMSAEITELRALIRLSDKEASMSSQKNRVESTSNQLHRNSAFHESNRLRLEVDKMKHERDQEMSRNKIELDDLRQRLNKAERELVNSKEECIHMTSGVQALERELHLAKMARDSIERGRAEDLKLIRKQTQDREEALKMKMEESEDRHNQASHEMETMLLKQNKLIMKLREECKKQAINLEKSIKKYRTQNGKLLQSNEEMSRRMERLVGRTSELEDQSDQHARVHDKMRDRLKALDDQGQNQAVQLVEALTKYSQMTRDRQLLAREVEFLRTQLFRANLDSAEPLRVTSASKTLVDDILNAMTKEERLGNEALLPQLQLKPEDIPDKVSLEDSIESGSGD